MTKLEQKLEELGYSQVLFDLPMYNQYKEKGFYIVIELDDEKKRLKNIILITLIMILMNMKTIMNMFVLKI